MKTDLLISQSLKIPEVKTEVLWYLEKYMEHETHPWLKYSNELYLDLEIDLPKLPETVTPRILIGLIVLIYDYDLISGIYPGSYRIVIDELGPLDEIEDLITFISYSFATLVSLYYEVNEKGEIEKLESDFAERVLKWNRNSYIIQEQVISLLGEQLNEVANHINIDIRELPMVINDYVNRMDTLRLRNLSRFFNKADSLLGNSNPDPEQARFFKFFVNEVKNGGRNLKTTDDVIPKFSDINYRFLKQ